MKTDKKLFTVDSYRFVLEHALENNFKFITFNNINSVNINDKCCLLRHDVDVNMQYALEMARVEAQVGISSTYFFMLRSPAYNLLSRFCSIGLKEIIKLGHEIGLHFDASHPDNNQKDTISNIQYEVELLEWLIKKKIYSFSFHQPTSEIIKDNILVDNLVNTYNKSQLEEWYYISDSNCVWKEYDALSVFEHKKKIQLLIHPIWWMTKKNDVSDIWDEANILNFEIMEQQFLETERAYGSKRNFIIQQN